MKIVLLLALTIATAIAYPEGVQIEDLSGAMEDEYKPEHPGMSFDSKANMNEYFDSVLEQAKIFMVENNMVPLNLPNSVNGFCVRWLFIDYHGELELTNGELVDLTTISRRGDAELFYGDRIMNINAVVGFDIIRISYDYLAKIMGIGPDGGVIGTAKDITYYCDIVINMDTGEAHVDRLQSLSTGSLDLKFTGTIIMDVILNAMSDVITWLFKDIIMNVITVVVKMVINSVLAGMTGVPPTPAP